LTDETHEVVSLAAMAAADRGAARARRAVEVGLALVSGGAGAGSMVVTQSWPVLLVVAACCGVGGTIAAPFIQRRFERIIAAEDRC
jgi:hypothetical protein